MTKIKILFLVSTLKKSGPVNILYGIVKNLDKKQFDVYIACLSEEKKFSQKERFETLETKVINLNNSRLRGIIKNKSAIQTLVELHTIDLVHSHGFRADLINAQLKKVSRFTTIHNFPQEDYVLQFGRMKGLIMAEKHQKAISAIENRVACSEYIKNKFFSNYNTQTSCIQNGIDINAFQNTMLISKTDLRKKLHLPVHKNIFIVSGSLIKRKDPLTILNAFLELELDQNFLLFLGTGKLEKKLKANYKSSNIAFVGGVSNISDYLYASDFFVSASLSEGLPNAVLEAMYTDLPVILSDISSHKEIVTDQYPFLFESKNISDLKQKMSDMLKGLYAASWKTNSKIVQERFSAKKMAMAYCEKYQDQCQNLVK